MKESKVEFKNFNATLLDCIQEAQEFDGSEFTGTVHRAYKGELLNALQKDPDIGEFSDGYHTFNELYEYRMLYNAAFFNTLEGRYNVHKSRRHSDGKECFGGGWFIVMADLPTGQISNHYELKDWDLFKVPEKELADKWDGHTPQEAARRLREFLTEWK